MDAYLNSYCESATPLTKIINSGPTTTITVTDPALTFTQTETITITSHTTVTNAGETVTSTVTCTPSARGSQCIPSSTNSTTTFLAQSSREHNSVLALGALLALVMVVLLTVITGWVWTCSVMKKREMMNNNSDLMR